MFVVDDDRRVRESIAALLSTFDLNVVTFGSATEYLAYPRPDVPACLILDVQLPDINGLDLQQQAGQGKDEGKPNPQAGPQGQAKGEKGPNKDQAPGQARDGRGRGRAEPAQRRSRLGTDLFILVAQRHRQRRHRLLVRDLRQVAQGAGGPGTADRVAVAQVTEKQRDRGSGRLLEVAQHITDIPPIMILTAADALHERDHYRRGMRPHVSEGLDSRPADFPGPIREGGD